MTYLDVLKKMAALSVANLTRTGFGAPFSALWVMKHPDTHEVRAEPGVLVLPPPAAQREIEAWFRSVEQKAMELDAVAAGLVTVVARSRERFLIAQLEERGNATLLWKARIRERAGKIDVGPMKPDDRGVSTMTVLPPDRARSN